MSPRELSITQSRILGVRVPCRCTIWAAQDQIKTCRGSKHCFSDCQILKQFIKSILFSFGGGPDSLVPWTHTWSTCCIVVHWLHPPISFSLSAGRNQWLWMVYTQFWTQAAPSTTGCPVSHLLSADPAKPYDFLASWDFPSYYLEGELFFWVPEEGKR